MKKEFNTITTNEQPISVQNCELNVLSADFDCYSADFLKQIIFIEAA